MKAPEWSWQGAVALILAIGIFLAESLLCIGEAVKLVRGFELSGAGINLITATLSALVGATATFLGRVVIGGGNAPMAAAGPPSQSPAVTTTPPETSTQVAPRPPTDAPPQSG